jgi:2-amino-4-hydroxy-6-hydroxymethyldihydropteridine diphosphokinase
MAEVYLLLGSNLGDRLQMLEKACENINTQVGTIVQFSSIYETEPWGFVADLSFFNQVVLVQTNLKPRHLLETVLEIEKEFGRKRNSDHYESRSIDIDILFYEDKVINESDLEIPHPKIQERMFVLKPMMEISPDMFHPELKKNILQLYNECSDSFSVEKYNPII